MRPLPRVPALVVVLVVAALVLSSCGRYEPPVGPGLPAPTTEAEAVEPTQQDLVGDWVEVDAEGRRVHGPDAASLQLLGDGRFGGSVGCVPLGGDAWTRAGRLVRLGPRERGEGSFACLDDDRSWLDSTPVLRWSDGLLEALEPGGRVVGWMERDRTVLRREAASSREPLRRADLVGSWRSESLPDRGSITLGADGTVTGHDGCNRFGGDTWRLHGDRVLMSGSRFTTTAACFGSAAWLSGADVLAWESGVLVASGAEGAYLGHLYRAR